MASINLGCTTIAVISRKFRGRAALLLHCGLAVCFMPSRTLAFLGSTLRLAFCSRAPNNKPSVPGSDQPSDPIP